MPGAQTNSRIAGGTINPSSFLQTNPSNPYYPELSCLQCSGAGVEIIGISQEWTNAPNGLINGPAQGPPAAIAGQRLRVYGDGEETIIMVGSGYTVEPDMLLTSDASGNAIPATIPGASATWIGARAIEGGAAADVIRVTVQLRGPYKAS